MSGVEGIGSRKERRVDEGAAQARVVNDVISYRIRSVGTRVLTSLSVQFSTNMRQLHNLPYRRVQLSPMPSNRPYYESPNVLIRRCNETLSSATRLGPIPVPSKTVTHRIIVVAFFDIS